MGKKWYFLVLAVMLLVTLRAPPVRAQDGWPQGCDFPEIEGYLPTGKEARENGNLVAYLTVINQGNLNNGWDAELRMCVEEAAQWVQLHRVNLSGANLQDASLQYADFSGANLQHVNLSNSNLRQADLRWVNLSGADLRGANLEGANLHDSNLQGADFQNAYFNMDTILPDRSKWTRNSDLRQFTNPAAWAVDQHGQLQGAYLRGADLSELSLASADLQDAYLEKANLTGVNLRDANLQQAWLWGADLQEANLSNANLMGANLSFTNLREASLRNGALPGTDLYHANLDGVDLNGTTFDKDTTLPDGTQWSESTDMHLFTDPEHPNFWQPGWVKN